MDELIHNDQILIEKYLDKTLTDSELAIFNQRMTDAQFAAEVQHFEKSVVAIKGFGDAKLKAILQEEEAKLQNKDNSHTENLPPQYSRTFRWVLAIVIVSLLGFFAWYSFNKKRVNDAPKKSIYATHFTPYRNYETPNVRDNNSKNTIEKAFSLYDNGKYQEALIYFEQLTLNSDQPNLLFFQANAYLATRQIEKAIPLLEKISQNNSEWQQKGEWYLAIALSEINKEEAVSLLNKIKNTPNHPYQKQAQSINF